MRIGIDVDGVLTDICQWQLDCGSKYSYEHNLKGIVNPYSQETYDVFELNKFEDDDFWNKYLYEYIMYEPARKYASEVIKKLKDENNEIYIVTARYETVKDTPLGEEMRNILKSWLAKNNIYYDKIIYTTENKVPYCIDNSIEIMIEDSPKNIESLSKYIPIICFNSRYNQNCTGNNITQCFSWYDIYENISKKSFNTNL